MINSLPLHYDVCWIFIWQVHVCVVSLMSLLGIQLGIGRQSWYLSSGVFCGALLLFVPLQAPEPAILFLITIPILAVASRQVHKVVGLGRSTLPRNSTQTKSKPLLQFGLNDLLWLTVTVALLTLLLVSFRSVPWQIPWLDMSISAICFAILAVAALCAYQQPTWRRDLLAAAILCGSDRDGRGNPSSLREGKLAADCSARLDSSGTLA